MKLNRFTSIALWAGIVVVLVASLTLVSAQPFAPLFLPVVLRSTDEIEPNNELTTATGPILPSVTYRGFPNDQRDYFFFETGGAGPVVIDIRGHQVSGGQLSLRDQNNNRVEDKFVSTPPNYHLEFSNLPQGKYYVFVFVDTSKAHDPAAPYTLAVEYLPPPT